MRCLILDDCDVTSSNRRAVRIFCVFCFLCDDFFEIALLRIECQEFAVGIPFVWTDEAKHGSVDALLYWRQSKIWKRWNIESSKCYAWSARRVLSNAFAVPLFSDALASSLLWYAAFISGLFGYSVIWFSLHWIIPNWSILLWEALPNHLLLRNLFDCTRVSDSFRSFRKFLITKWMAQWNPHSLDTNSAEKQR